MKNLMTLTVGALLFFIGVTDADAALMSFVGATDGSWHELSNWTSDGSPATQEPTSSDTVQLNGKTVHITETAALGVWSGGGYVDIDNGGHLTGHGNYSLRYISGIRVNNGGVLQMPNYYIRTNVTINEGGEAYGTYGIGANDSRTLTVDGTFSPRGTTTPGATSFFVGSARWGRVHMGSTGTILLDTYGDGDNEFFAVNGMTTSTQLTLDTGSVELRLQDGYTPDLGDVFTIWTLADESEAVMALGDGSNISMPGLGSGLSLDTSQFETTGAVTVVPEPATLGLFLAAVLAFLRCRRV